ncbi:MAG: FAD-dependent pyridine nucleotide-disulfide oxidoreductase [Planctomycetaceae bacterium]|nr:FAD-dependent pyridine nucleotide-disulfide oxidoreductase [Planctomycetaceae bacterium]
MDFDLLVIGASAAGWQVAIAAARLDRKVGLIELRCKTQVPEVDLRAIPGGLLRDVCADWPIFKSGRRSEARRMETASWRQFADYTMRIWQQEQDAYRHQLLSAGGKFWTGDATLSGPHGVSLKRPRVKTVELRSDHLLIATGTTPRSPNFAREFVPPAENAAWILASAELSGDACVVGASLTGLRAACLLALWGSRVRLVDGRVIAETTEQEDSTEWFAWGHELGVRFETGEDVIGLRTQSHRKMEVILESGRHIATETVWLATGRQGQTAALRLASTGLTTDDCGRLWCDPKHRTWVPSISAVGDVVGFPRDAVWDAETSQEVAKNLQRSVPTVSYVGVN